MYKTDSSSICTDQHKWFGWGETQLCDGCIEKGSEHSSRSASIFCWRLSSIRTNCAILGDWFCTGYSTSGFQSSEKYSKWSFVKSQVPD